MAPSTYGKFGRLSSNEGIQECNTAAIGTKQPEVHAAIETLVNNVSEVDKVLDELCGRIEPILSHSVPAPASTDEPSRAPQCAIADAIDKQNGRIDVLRDRIYDVIRRVQI